MIFEGDDLSNVRGFVAAGLGVAVVPAPRAGSPEAVPGPVAYLEILDQGAVRQIFLTWFAERRLLPATDLFRRHVIRRAAAGRLPGRGFIPNDPGARHPARHDPGARHPARHDPGARHPARPAAPLGKPPAMIVALVFPADAADRVDLAGLAAGVHQFGPPLGGRDDTGRYQRQAVEEAG